MRSLNFTKILPFHLYLFYLSMFELPNFRVAVVLGVVQGDFAAHVHHSEVSLANLTSEGPEILQGVSH